MFFARKKDRTSNEIICTVNLAQRKTIRRYSCLKNVEMYEKLFE